ncbi:MAG: PQQ-dependent sugar dehydrogenase [Verrucomicrobiota bacterium]|nr:PQQ-dependent sugar dehydrogenase [Verrucomicrobiota bacterium]
MIRSRVALLLSCLTVLLSRSAGGSSPAPLHFENTVKVPNGFVYEVIAKGNVPEPMDLEFSPDGMLWGTGRAGSIWRMKPDGSDFKEVVKLAVDHSDDRGLHGIEFHPDFVHNGLVYLYYSPVLTNGLANRFSRFQFENPTGNPRLLLESEKIFLQLPSEKVGQHQGGAIEYHPLEKKLYITTGDNNWNNDLATYFDDPNNKAQNLNDLRGKVLRLNLDGSIPEENPFARQPGKRGEIYSYGHRQPFTLAIDPLTGTIYEGENGGDRTEDFEEINLLKAGANYGWPREIGKRIGTYGGEKPLTSAEPAWFTYQRTATASSCIVGALYRPSGGKGDFPLPFHGRLFYADYARKWIRSIQIDEGKEPHSEPFARGFAGGPLAVIQGPDGALYFNEYTAVNGSPQDRISRIRHKP